jgi:hypothetical protein
VKRKRDLVCGNLVFARSEFVFNFAISIWISLRDFKHANFTPADEHQVMEDNIDAMIRERQDVRQDPNTFQLHPRNLTVVREY